MPPERHHRDIHDVARFGERAQPVP
jgi:hypothetical protein